MALLKIDTPIFQLKQPSTGKMIKYRPYNMSEEKMLLVAYKSGEEKDIYNNLVQVIQNCILTPNIEVEKLPQFDIEYIYLNLRAQTVEKDVVLRFQGRSDLECDECKKVKEVTVDLTTIEIAKFPDHNSKVEFSTGKGLIMKYPTIAEMSMIEAAKASGNFEDVFRVIASCISLMYDGDTIIEPEKDSTIEQVMQWVEDLPRPYYDKVCKFFDTMPTVSYDIHFECPKCKLKSDIKLSGLSDFLV